MTMVDPALHPKMYDLTIPTTLNFGLANGLQVRDTSQTGYIQRRLIKGMEDLKVEYDMTVRNGKQRIIQFSYGDDGIDTIKVENQSLPLVAMSLDEIYAHFHMPLDNSSETEESSVTAFTKTAYAKMKKEKSATTKKIRDLIDYMIEMRDLIIERVFSRLDNKNVQMPVSFTHHQQRSGTATNQPEFNGGYYAAGSNGYDIRGIPPTGDVILCATNCPFQGDVLLLSVAERTPTREAIQS